MKRIIVGAAGTYKTALVARMIRNHNGRVIWITNNDERENLQLNDVRTLDERKESNKIIIIVDPDKPMSMKTKYKIQSMLHQYSENEDTLFIFDKASVTTEGILTDILLKETINCILVFQSMLQIKTLLNLAHMEEDIDFLLTYIRHWDIICSSNFDKLMSELREERE